MVEVLHLPFHGGLAPRLENGMSHLDMDEVGGLAKLREGGRACSVHKLKLKHLRFEEHGEFNRESLEENFTGFAPGLSLRNSNPQRRTCAKAPNSDSRPYVSTLADGSSYRKGSQQEENEREVHAGLTR